MRPEQRGWAMQFSPPAWGWSDIFQRIVSRALFSPPAWGWSAVIAVQPDPVGVFPTRVGMAGANCPAPVDWLRFPHPRGDGPWPGQAHFYSRRFSPPAGDGPTLLSSGISSPARVFPTRVGMVRNAKPMLADGSVFSTAWGWSADRGDAEQNASQFSPPAWGWSGGRDYTHGDAAVFPTRVGMVRA